MARRKTPRARRRNQIAKRGGAGRSRARSSAAAPKKRTAKSPARQASARKSARLRKASAKQARPAKASRGRGKASATQIRARKAASSRGNVRKASSGQPRKATPKTGAQVSRKTARAGAAVRPPQPAFVARKAPSLDRERRIVRDDDLIPTPPSSLDLDRSASAARSGRRELHERFVEHTETSPAITGGDIDADWESAYSVGDEAPGGDNPTPDQDVVDDIGRAIGVQYEDNEELKGETKIKERDRKRWELDPASSEDYNDR